MGLSLTELKAYLRVDYDDDDAVIQMIRDAVIEEMQDLIPGFNKTEITSRQKILICAYSKELYDNRGQTAKTNEKLRYCVQSLMLKERLRNV